MNLECLRPVTRYDLAPIPLRLFALYNRRYNSYRPLKIASEEEAIEDGATGEHRQRAI